ncbi:MAG: response regulator transcription factor [Bacteroidota bacterium]
MTTTKKITIVIADDHPMFRSGVKQALENEPSFSVIGEAGDGERALQLLNELSPDAAVFDMNMPKMTGLAAAKEYKKKNGRTEIIFLTMFDDEEILNEAMDIGVKGYILKESASIDIVSAVRSVIQGQFYISPVLTGKLLARKEKQSEFTKKNPGLEKLSDTERRILLLIAESKTSKEIAEVLFLSQKTIDNYRFKISEKLNLSGSYSLLKFALENKSHL